jgi:hypothetical protein
VRDLYWLILIGPEAQESFAGRVQLAMFAQPKYDINPGVAEASPKADFRLARQLADESSYVFARKKSKGRCVKCL